MCRGLDLLLDVTAWRQALIDCLHDADGCRVLSLDGTMKIAMGLRRYETMIPHREEGVVDNRVDDNTCVLTVRALEGGLLGLAVVPNDSKPCHVVTALEGAIRDVQRSGVHWLVVDKRKCRIMRCCSSLFPWITKSGVGHLLLAHEVRGCGIESQVP